MNKTQNDCLTEDEFAELIAAELTSPALWHVLEGSDIQ